MGEFNRREGKSDQIYADIIGKFGEYIRNNSGQRLLEYCLLNNLVVANTIYEHRDIHKSISVAPTKIVLDERSSRYGIVYVQVSRAPDIFSDNHIVIAKIKGDINRNKIGEQKNSRKPHETIRIIYKLNIKIK